LCEKFSRTSYLFYYLSLIKEIVWILSVYLILLPYRNSIFLFWFIWYLDVEHSYLSVKVLDSTVCEMKDPEGKLFPFLILEDPLLLFFCCHPSYLFDTYTSVGKIRSLWDSIQSARFSQLIKHDSHLEFQIYCKK
jgi:hypothetical protein